MALSKMQIPASYPTLVSQNFQETNQRICISKTNSQSVAYDQLSVRKCLLTICPLLPDAETGGGRGSIDKRWVSNGPYLREAHTPVRRQDGFKSHKVSRLANKLCSPHSGTAVIQKGANCK